ncbi:MAG: hypothetical protein WC841_04870 [Candidatus Shapirobacteria bacterium]|jgi:hypothetical protein
MTEVKNVLCVWNVSEWDNEHKRALGQAVGEGLATASISSEGLATVVAREDVYPQLYRRMTQILNEPGVPIAPAAEAPKSRQ